jgi:hypothetical protein
MTKSDGSLFDYNKCLSLASLASSSAASGWMDDAAAYLAQAERIATTDKEIDRCAVIRERIYGVHAEGRIGGVLRGGLVKDGRFNYHAHGPHSVAVSEVIGIVYL